MHLALHPCLLQGTCIFLSFSKRFFMLTFVVDPLTALRPGPMLPSPSWMQAPVLLIGCPSVSRSKWLAAVPAQGSFRERERERERERCGQGSPLWRGLHPPRQRTPRSSPFPKHDGDLHLLGDDTVAHRGTPWHTVAHRGTVLMCASIKNRWPLVQASATLLPPWFEPGAVPWPS